MQIRFSLLAIAIFVAAASAQTQLLLPAFGSTFSSASTTRGFYFQTPVAITITGLRVPDEAAAGVQCVEVSALAGAPPAYPVTASGGQVFYANNVPSSVVIPCSLNFAAGSWIGVMGACGTATLKSSYGAGPFNTTIAGQPVTLSRFLTQTNLNTSGNQPYSSDSSATGSIGRVEVYYNRPPLTTPVAMPAFSSTFASSLGTRGFYFQTPVPIIIRGLRVPDEMSDGTQNVEVKRMASAPPAFPATASGGEVFYANNVPSYQIIPCSLPFQAGDWVGILGACGTTTMLNSYGTPTGQFASSIGGNPVTLTRFRTETNLNTSGSQPYSAETTNRISRIEVYYEIATGVASATTNGIGCGATSRAFYEMFSAGGFGTSTFDLRSTAMTLVLSGGRYVATPTGTYVPPSAAATTLVLADDSDTLITLGSAFPYPGGSTSFLRVCSNGFVSVSAGNGTAAAPNAMDWLNSPVARWGTWYDFDPAAAGSGLVKFQEVGSVSYVTWDGVSSPSGIIGGPQTNFWQLQFDRTTGNVTYAWQSMLNFAWQIGPLVGFAPGQFPAVDLGSLDISAQWPGGFSTHAFDSPHLAFAASARPVIGTTINLVTSNIPLGSPFGATLLGLVAMNASLAGLGAPGCRQYVDPLATSVFLIGGPTAGRPFLVPNNPYLLGLHVYGESATYSPGANALNVLFSNRLDLGINFL
ncbi:MAG: hypothetical protein Q7T30_04570 [Planctomycetota bacterium]|nr:hypothetical protein [Planctomycetota bacterium]